MFLALLRKTQNTDVFCRSQSSGTRIVIVIVVVVLVVVVAVVVVVAMVACPSQ